MSFEVGQHVAFIQPMKLQRHPIWTMPSDNLVQTCRVDAVEPSSYPFVPDGLTVTLDGVTFEGKPFQMNVTSDFLCAIQ